MKLNCKDCRKCKTGNGRVYCVLGFWDKTYSFDTVIRGRSKVFTLLPKRCNNYSPPEQDEVFDKSDFNRKRIGRIIEALRDGRKHWNYDERPIIKDAFWEDWE